MADNQSEVVNDESKVTSRSIFTTADIINNNPKKPVILDEATMSLNNFNELQASLAEGFKDSNPDLQRGIQAQIMAGNAYHDMALLDKATPKEVSSGLAREKTKWGESYWDNGGFATQAEFDNVKELRAENQGNMIQIMNGIGKMVVTAGTTFANGTLGTIWGIGAAIQDGRFSSLYDNSFTRTMQQVSNWAEENMPNYYTDQEIYGPWYSNIISGNFLGDKVFKNFGFTIGSVGAMMAGGGIGTVGKGISALGKAALKKIALARGASVANTARIATGALGKNFGKFVYGITGHGKGGFATVGNFAKSSITMLGSTFGESGLEAIDHMDQFKQDQMDARNARYQQELAEAEENLNNLDNGTHEECNAAMDAATQQVQEDYRNGKLQLQDGELLFNKILEARDAVRDQFYKKYTSDIRDNYEKDKKAIDFAASVVGNRVFIKNALLLSLTEAGMFGKLLSKGYDSAVRTTAKSGLGGVGTETVGGKTLYTNTYKNYEKAKKIYLGAKNPIFEGSQEILQNFAGAGSENIGNALMDEYYASGRNMEAAQENVKTFDAFCQGVSNTYANGLASSVWEEGFIGALTGMFGIPMKTRIRNGQNQLEEKASWHLMGGSFGDIRDFNTNKAITDKYVNAANEWMKQNTTDGDIASMETRVRALTLNRQMNQAVQNNDKAAYKTAETQAFLNDIQVFHNLGRLDDLKDLYERALSTEGKSKEEVDAMLKEFDDLTVDPITGQGPFRDETGTPNYTSEDGRKKAIEELQNKKKEFLRMVDQYATSRQAFDEDYGGRLSDAQLNTLTWYDNNMKEIRRRSNQLYDIIKENIGGSEGMLEALKDLQQSLSETADPKTYAKVNSMIKVLDDLLQTPTYKWNKYFQNNQSNTYKELQEKNKKQVEDLLKQLKDKKITVEEFNEKSKGLQKEFEDEYYKSGDLSAIDLFNQAIDAIRNDPDTSNSLWSKKIDSALNDAKVLAEMEKDYAKVLAEYTAHPENIFSTQKKVNKKNQEQVQQQIEDNIKDTISKIKSVEDIKNLFAKNLSSNEGIQELNNWFEAFKGDDSIPAEAKKAMADWKDLQDFTSNILKELAAYDSTGKANKIGLTANQIALASEIVKSLAGKANSRADFEDSQNGAYLTSSIMKANETLNKLNLTDEDFQTALYGIAQALRNLDATSKLADSFRRPFNSKVPRIYTPAAQEVTEENPFQRVLISINPQFKILENEIEDQSNSTASEENKFLPSVQGEKDQLAVSPSNPYEYWKPQVPEYAEDKDGNFVPYPQAIQSRPGHENEDHSPIYEYLKGTSTKSSKSSKPTFYTVGELISPNDNSADYDANMNKPYVTTEREPQINDALSGPSGTMVQAADLIVSTNWNYIKEHPEHESDVEKKEAARPNGFDFVNKGNLKEGDDIEFVVMEDWENQCKDKKYAWHSPSAPSIFMRHKKSGVIVGVVAEGKAAENQKGLTDLRKDVTEKFAKEGFTNGVYVYPYTTKVNQVLIGRLNTTNTETSLLDIQNFTKDTEGEQVSIELGVITADQKLKGSVKEEDIEPLDSPGSKLGRTYLLIKNARGKYSASRVSVAHYNNSEINLGTPGFKESPLGQKLYNALASMSQVKDNAQLFQAYKKLSEVLWTGGTYVELKEDTDSALGPYISIRYYKKSNSGAYVTTTIKGQTVPESQYLRIYLKDTSKLVVKREKDNKGKLIEKYKYGEEFYSKAELAALYEANKGKNATNDAALSNFILNELNPNNLNDKTVEDIVQELDSKFLMNPEVNLSFRVSQSALTSKDAKSYINDLVQSKVLTSNIQSLVSHSAWFTTDRLSGSNRVEAAPVKNKGVNNKRHVYKHYATVVIANMFGSTTAIQTEYMKKTYYVDIEHRKIYDADQKDITKDFFEPQGVDDKHKNRLFFEGQKLFAEAEAGMLYGVETDVPGHMIDNVVVLQARKGFCGGYPIVYDRRTGKFFNPVSSNQDERNEYVKTYKDITGIQLVVKNVNGKESLVQETIIKDNLNEHSKLALEKLEGPEVKVQYVLNGQIQEASARKVMTLVDDNGNPRDVYMTIKVENDKTYKSRKFYGYFFVRDSSNQELKLSYVQTFDQDKVFEKNGFFQVFKTPNKDVDVDITKYLNSLRIALQTNWVHEHNGLITLKHPGDRKQPQINNSQKLDFGDTSRFGTKIDFTKVGSTIYSPTSKEVSVVVELNAKGMTYSSTAGQLEVTGTRFYNIHEDGTIEQYLRSLYNNKTIKLPDLPSTNPEYQKILDKLGIKNLNADTNTTGRVLEWLKTANVGMGTIQGGWFAAVLDTEKSNGVVYKKAVYGYALSKIMYYCYATIDPQGNVKTLKKFGTDMRGKTHEPLSEVQENALKVYNSIKSNTKISLTTKNKKPIQLVQSGVTFYEDEHKYTIEQNGVTRELQGITGTLIPLVGDVYEHPTKLKDQENLKWYMHRKQVKGSLVHKTIETGKVIDETMVYEPAPDGIRGNSTENSKQLSEGTLAEYNRLMSENGFTCIAHEYNVGPFGSSDSLEGNFASNIDLVVRDKDGNVWLGDIKHTREVHYIPVSTQLSLYKRAFELQNPKLKVKGIFVMHIEQDSNTNKVFGRLIPNIDTANAIHNGSLHVIDNEKLKDLIRTYEDPQMTSHAKVEFAKNYLQSEPGWSENLQKELTTIYTNLDAWEAANKSVETKQPKNPIVKSTGNAGVQNDDNLVDEISDDNDDILFQTVTNQELQNNVSYTLNHNEAIEWLNRVLPQVTKEHRLEFVQGLIQHGNVHAWGAFDKGMITLSDLAANPVVYHEAFHFVFNTILNCGDRQVLYRDARKAFGNLSNRELEEKMADEFKEYVMTKTAKKSLGQKILQFFKNLLNKLLHWNSKTKLSREIIYKAIEQGKFANSEVHPTDYLSDNNERWTDEQIDTYEAIPKDKWGKPKTNGVPIRDFINNTSKVDTLTEQQSTQLYNDVASFFNNFGINLSEVDAVGQNDLFNALGRTVNISNVDDISRGTGAAIAFMMRHDEEVSRVMKSPVYRRALLKLGRIVSKIIPFHSDRIIYNYVLKLDKDLALYADAISGELIKLYSGKVSPSQPVEQSLLESISTYFNKMLGFKATREDQFRRMAAKIALGIKNNDKTVIAANNIKPGETEEGIRLDIEKAIKENPYEASIIEILSGYNILLGGSASIAVVGSIYRSGENPMHDIDFAAPKKTVEELEDILRKEFKNVKETNEIRTKGKDKYTKTYLIMDRPFIEEPVNSSFTSKIVAKISGRRNQNTIIKDATTGQILGRRQGSNLILEKGVVGKMLDFFMGSEQANLGQPFDLEIDGRHFKFQDADNAMDFKVNVHRNKDLFDYARFIRNTFIPNAQITNISEIFNNGEYSNENNDIGFERVIEQELEGLKRKIKYTRPEEKKALSKALYEHFEDIESENKAFNRDVSLATSDYTALLNKAIQSRGRTSNKVHYYLSDDTYYDSEASNAYLQEIYDNYSAAIGRHSEYRGNLKYHIGSGNAVIYEPFSDDHSVLVGQMHGDVMTVSHFAPTSLRKGVSLIKKALDDPMPIIFAVPEYLANQLEKAGYTFVTEIPQIFAGEWVMKKVMINNAVTSQDLINLVESSKSGFESYGPDTEVASYFSRNYDLTKVTQDNIKQLWENGFINEEQYQKMKDLKKDSSNHEFVQNLQRKGMTLKQYLESDEQFRDSIKACISF